MSLRWTRMNFAPWAGSETEASIYQSPAEIYTPFGVHGLGAEGDVQVTFVDMTGSKRLSARVAPDMPVVRILPFIVTKMGLPVTAPDGTPMSYSLDHQETGVRLLETDTLRKARVQPGDHLIVYPEMVAGFEYLEGLMMLERAGIGGPRMGLSGLGAVSHRRFIESLLDVAHYFVETGRPQGSWLYANWALREARKRRYTDLEGEARKVLRMRGVTARPRARGRRGAAGFYGGY